MSKEVIEQIHATMRTFIKKTKRQSRLKDLSKQESNSDVLRKLGFGNAQNVRDYQEESEKQRQKAEDTYNYNMCIEKAKYYHKKYGLPCVSIDVVKEICDKYGLVFISAAGYTGKIPQKNIDELASWDYSKLTEEDVAYSYQDSVRSTFDQRWLVSQQKTNLGKIRMRQILGMDSPEEDPEMRYVCVERFVSMDAHKAREYGYCNESSKLRIICPINEVDGFGHYKYAPLRLLERNSARICDPVVLVPVSGADRMNTREKTPMFMVLTMWGLEAFDSKLNPDGVDRHLNLN